MLHFAEFLLILLEERFILLNFCQIGFRGIFGAGAFPVLPFVVLWGGIGSGIEREGLEFFLGRVEILLRFWAKGNVGIV